MKSLLSALAVVAALLCASDAIAQSTLTIFVGPHVRDGFVDVDQGVLDSIKDVQDEFRRSKQFTVVRSAGEARIVVIVVTRRISGQAGAVGITVAPGVTSVLPYERRAIDILLRVDSYERAITSEDESGSGVWRAAARRVARDVSAWTEANSAALAGSVDAPQR